MPLERERNQIYNIFYRIYNDAKWSRWKLFSRKATCISTIGNENSRGARPARNSGTAGLFLEQKNNERVKMAESVVNETVANLTAAVNETAKNATGRAAATTEGMLVAYSSLVLMALLPIFFGSFRSVKYLIEQKVCWSQNFWFFSIYFMVVLRIYFLLIILKVLSYKLTH